MQDHGRNTLWQQTKPGANKVFDVIIPTGSTNRDSMRIYVEELQYPNKKRSFSKYLSTRGLPRDNESSRPR